MSIERIITMILRRVVMKGARKVMSDQAGPKSPEVKSAGQTMKLARRFGRMTGRL